MTSVARTTNNQCSILKEYCDDVISHNGKYYYEQNKTAKNILQISNTTFDSKIKNISPEHRINKDSKTYIYQETVIKNLRETNQLFVIPLLEKLNFIIRKTFFDTRTLGPTIPFSRIRDNDTMKITNNNGNQIKGLRDELLFLDSSFWLIGSI